MNQPGAKSFPRGQSLFLEGETPRKLFIIIRGTVAVRKSKGEGFIELARLHANEAVGEMSFFDRQSRSASAIALTDVEALEIDFESLEKIYKNTPPYFRTIMASVAERLRRADELIRRLDKDIQLDRGKLGSADGGAMNVASVLAAIDEVKVEESSKGSSKKKSDEEDSD